VQHKTNRKAPFFNAYQYLVGILGHAYATPLFPYVELIYVHWYTRTYQTESAV